jgi:dTDP-4-amino-4,6-dideoxygalactose transaminase
VEAIGDIAERHGLQVIYDAAHAFGVQVNGRSVLEYGDLSALSFHATKLFSSIEGGALVSHSQTMYDRIRYLKNFGIAGEETVIGPGINGKMNEFQAAFGLLALESVDEEIRQRKALTELYRQRLKGLPGLWYLEELAGVRQNYGYFPVVVDPAVYGTSRDSVCDVLRACGIYPRKYFYPLCSNYPCYSALHSSSRANLPTANRIAEQVLCLPLYGELDPFAVEQTCAVIRRLHETS